MRRKTVHVPNGPAMIFGRKNTAHQKKNSSSSIKNAPRIDSSLHNDSKIPPKYDTPLVEERGRKEGPRIHALDLDGVVFDYYGKFNEIDETIPKEYPSQYNMVKSGSFRDKEHFLDMHDKVMEYPEKLKPLEDGIAESIRKIRETGDKVIVITARKEKERNGTLLALEQLGIEVDAVHIVGWGSNKTDINYDTILDDAPHNIEDAINNPNKPLPVVREQKYNMDVDGDVPRVSTIREYAEAIVNKYL